MPCYDDRDSHPERYAQDQQLADAQSTICFLTSALGAVWGCYARLHRP